MRARVVRRSATPSIGPVTHTHTQKERERKKERERQDDGEKTVQKGLQQELNKEISHTHTACSDPHRVDGLDIGAPLQQLRRHGLMPEDTGVMQRRALMLASCERSE